MTMRFIITYATFVEDLLQLVSSCNVTDVRVLDMKGEKEPSAPLLRDLGGAESEVICVEVNKRYVKALERMGYRPRRFSSQGGTAAIREWIGAPPENPGPVLTPTLAFMQAAKATPRLVIAYGALDHADEMASMAYPFSNRAAVALTDYVERGCKLDSMSIEDFFRHTYGLISAPQDARVRFTVDVQPAAAKARIDRSFHLKGGCFKRGNELAPRVYFCKILFQTTPHVAVLYCGPHLDPGEYRVTVRLP